MTAKKQSPKGRSNAKSRVPVADVEEHVTPGGTVLRTEPVDSGSSEDSMRPNGVPNKGPDPELGMHIVQSSAEHQKPQVREAFEKGKTVSMKHRDGHVVDVEPADVVTHERMGWMIVGEEVDESVQE